MKKIKKILKQKNKFTKHIGKDLVAGLSVAVISIPEGIGFAMIVGVNPIYGLYTGIIATIIGAVSTGSRLMIVTLTNTLAISAASALAAIDAMDVAAAMFMLTILVGGFQLFFGFLKLDVILHFISNAVMTGFVAGSALLMMLGQIHNFTGYHADIETHNQFYKFYDWLAHISDFDVATTVVAFVTVLMIVILKNVPKIEHMSYAIALVIMTIVAKILDFQSVVIVGDDTPIPSGLPQLSVPDFSVSGALIVPAFAIALIGLIDAAGVQAVFGTKKERKAGGQRDFLGQGLANFLGGFVSSLPAGGSFSRTALNVESGAQSRFSGIFAGIITLCIVLLFAHFVELIPHAALAGLLMVIGMSVILRLIDDVTMVWHTSAAATIAMIVTFITTLLIPLYYAIFIGVALSILLYVFSASMKLKLRQMKRIGRARFKIAESPARLSSDSVTILTLYGNLFFAVVNDMDRILPSYEKAKNAVVIFRLRGRDSVNSTFIKLLEDYAEELHESGNTIMLSGVSKSVQEQLTRTGLSDVIGERNIFGETEILEESTEQAWQFAQKYIKKDDEFI